MAPNISIAISLLSIGLLTVALCVPLWQGKIKRNAFYGIRTPKAFESDELWFKINRYGAKQMIMWGVVMIVLGMAALIIPSNGVQMGMGAGPIVLLTLVVPCLQIFRYSNRL